MPTAWYLVHVKASQERLADFNLRKQGYRTFLPSSWRTIRHARKTRLERVALFPGYLFIALDVERDRWRQVDGTIGVVRLVTSLDRPVRAPQGVVELLIESSDADGIVDIARHVGIGDDIRVTRGALAGRNGLVERLVGADRVRILLSLLGGEIAVDLDRTACEAA